ncbi:small ubiquitin-related modifier 2-like [Apium graveolens]|uniref:small ubiquitin-related modifier 2-like n=1 Tax=Apium graveolens TaxID=4045 RepID=UPI003D795A84
MEKFITLTVKGQDDSEVYFQIKRSSQLRKLMIAYCERKLVEINSIRFIFDGKCLREEQTPNELEMENGDLIDAMTYQISG